MKKLLLILFIALGPPLLAQNWTGPFKLTANSQCVSATVSGQATVMMSVAGTFSATIQPKVAIQGQAAANVQVTPSTSTTAQSTITTTGMYKADVASADIFQLCTTSYASGTVTVYFNVSQQISTGLIASGASSGSVTSFTGDSAGLFNNAASTGAVTLSIANTPTGTGAVLVEQTSPSLITPALGAATATSVNGLTISTTTGTLTIPNGVTLTGPASSGTVLTSAVTNVTFTGDGTVLSSTPSTAVTTTGTLTAALATPAGGTVLNNTGAAAGAWTATPSLTLGVSSAGGTPTTGTIKLFNAANTGSVTLTPASGTIAATITVPDGSGTMWSSVANNVSDAAAILNLSGSTGTAAFILPSNTTNTATSAGVCDYDSTNKNVHCNVNAADSILLAVAAAPTTNVIPKYVVASGNTLTVGSSITDNGTTVSTAEPIVVGTAAGSAGITDKSAGFLAAAMGAQTTATCTTITGMNWNIAASKNYVLECKIPVTLAATATLQFCLNGPGTATSYTLEDDGGLGAASVWAQFSTFIQTAWQTKTGASSAVATDSIVHVWAGIQNGSTASGTQLALQTAANGTNAITVGANATCSLTQTN